VLLERYGYMEDCEILFLLGVGGGGVLLKGELFDRIATSVGRFEHFWGFPLERGHYT